jgi:tRNA pseudouridine38-40 synthase
VGHNYQIVIEYDGTNFVGWQYQKNGLSIQEVLEKKLKKVLKDKIRIIGAGRTDAGVHALEQSANFFINKKIENRKVFLNSINYFLRKHLISIIDVKKKKLNFHSRYSAKERIYEYRITNRYSSLALNKNRTWLVKKKLNIDLLKMGAKILQGSHNFSTFRASSCTATSPIKKMNKVKIIKKGKDITIQFQSKSFLQNQVRSMVGCLKYLSCKDWNLKKFKKVFKSKNRKLCAPPAPACGLYLAKIKY